MLTERWARQRSQYKQEELHFIPLHHHNACGALQEEAREDELPDLRKTDEPHEEIHRGFYVLQVVLNLYSELNRLHPTPPSYLPASIREAAASVDRPTRSPSPALRSSGGSASPRSAQRDPTAA